VCDGIPILNHKLSREINRSSSGLHLTTNSLSTLPWGDRVIRILHTAIHAVEPGEAIIRWMERIGDNLTIATREYPLDRYHRVLVVGVGKAAVPMGIAAVKVLGSRFTEGILLTKYGYAKHALEQPNLAGLTILEAGHPLPDERGVRGAKRISNLLAGTGEHDLVVCLISGGGSSLLSSPVAGINLADLQELTSLLLTCGASIDEINSLRKHLDTLKGGGLTRLTSPATLITLILSDVVGDPLDVIASGPSVPDPTTFTQAYGVLERYGIVNKTPASIRNYLLRGVKCEIPETPKPGDPVFEKVLNVIIGSNRLAAEAALAQARIEGFHSMLLTTSLQGEACQAGRFLGAIAREIVASETPLARPACVITGGETTVTIQGNGKGGRNQEMALGAVEDLAGLDGVALITLATDGGDGPTDAAGAVVTGKTLERARSVGLSTVDHLSRNDAYSFFDALDDLLKPGPTQTNVNDLAFLFVGDSR
jgi:glycerate 2-kinase